VKEVPKRIEIGKHPHSKWFTIIYVDLHCQLISLSTQFPWWRRKSPNFLFDLV
jgi:hypothetical protein